MDNEAQLLQERIRKIVADFRLIDDNFMTKFFEDKGCTQLLLRTVLERDDLIVQSVQSQYDIKNLQGRSIRLDIYATDQEGKPYNIEVQRSDSGATPQRARYHSSLIDANITEPGENMENLPETYVIFVTENDVQNGGLPLYHIERRIAETGELFDDKTHILYVNSQIQDDTPLGRLMHDFYCTKAADMHYPLLADRTKYLKETEEGATVMCRSVEKLCNDSRQAGMQAGAKEKEKKLVIKMLQQNISYEQIALISDLSIEEIEIIDAERKSK